jgi:phosphoenolpyruvate carboxykinase (ATP)
MSNCLNLKTPAQDQAEALKSDYDLSNHGLSNLGTVYWNLTPEALYEEIIFRGEGHVTHEGAVVVRSGRHTSRAAGDKFMVKEPSTEEDIWWGEYNRPYDPEIFKGLTDRIAAYVQGRDLFVQDCFVGVDPKHRMPIRIITEYAWHSLFSWNMFVKPESAEAYRGHVPEFTLIAVPSFQANMEVDKTNSTTVIALSFEKKLCLVGDTAYGGEIKKSIFTVMNYLLPLKGALPMHCSASVGKEGDAALYFGLSGTGKTTLSADIERGLIGDDEHGWGDDGIFNFEDGCFAKVIRLSPEAEPQIHATTHRYGTILENVIYDPVTREIDLDDPSITQNTRASYPLAFIENAIPEKMSGHPKNIILLTCDARGVMPPIARLTPAQALYHFVSGYTSKVGGTEAGVGNDPALTFSACFGAPFMVHHPAVYADLLREKIVEHDVNCWLLNTGWVGGPFGVGQRISIKYTRALLNAALSGALNDVPFYKDPLFGFEVPDQCPGVPDDVLHPAAAWPSEDQYWEKYRMLAQRFVDNFEKYASHCASDVCEAGPKL